MVAELTAALCGAMLGFATTPREESTAYIKDWLAEVRKEPTYLFDILTDVNRAARMISLSAICNIPKPKSGTASKHCCR